MHAAKRLQRPPVPRRTSVVLATTTVDTIENMHEDGQQKKRPNLCEGVQMERAIVDHHLRGLIHSILTLIRAPSRTVVQRGTAHSVSATGGRTAIAARKTGWCGGSGTAPHRAEYRPGASRERGSRQRAVTRATIAARRPRRTTPRRPSGRASLRKGQATGCHPMAGGVVPAAKKETTTGGDAVRRRQGEDDDGRWRGARRQREKRRRLWRKTPIRWHDLHHPQVWPGM